MTSSSKKIALTIIIACSIVVVLVTYHSTTRWPNLMPNIVTPRMTQTPKTLSLNTTSKSMHWKMTKDDFYFKAMCSNLNMTLPSVTLSQVRLEKFEDGIVEVTVNVLHQSTKGSSSKNDVIFVWAEQVNGNGRVSGVVRALGDGSYTGHVIIFWRGLTRIKAKIAESSINTCLRYRSLLRYGNVVYSIKAPWGLLGEFKNSVLQEKTRCGTTSYLYGYKDVCNFTATNDGSPWYCGQPRSDKLNCQHIYSFGTGAFHVDGVREQEKIKHPGHGTLSTSVTVDSRVGAYPVATATCKMASKRNSWTRTSISGFLGDVWQSIHCSGPSEHTDASYRTCLNGKTLVFIGDSTVRQYFEHILRTILHLDAPFKHGHGPGRTYRQTSVFSRYNITAYFRKHEMPWHLQDFPPHGILSTPSQLRDLAHTDTPGPSLVVILNYFSHFSAFPPSHFRQRIHTLVEGVQYLLAKKPGATVLYKSPHVCKVDNRWFDQNFSLLYRDILFEEFRDIMDNVIYLDVWDITIAHDNEDPHPKGRCMQSQIQQLMAYICE